MFTEATLPSGQHRIPIAIHRCPGTSTVIINYPGYNGQIQGYANKYVKLADYMVEQRLGTVVRMRNAIYADEDYVTTVQRDLRVVIEHMLEASGESDPEIYLIGTSAGGGAVAAVASSYPNVKKLLLVAPSFHILRTQIEASLPMFGGMVSIVVGLDDSITGTQASKRFEENARRASDVRTVHIPECDHYFSGTKNGRLLSQAPEWAFGDDESFPDPNGGIELY